MMKQLAPWDRDYSQGDAESIWGPPCRLYTEIIDRLPEGAQVLDAGCGDGRHSLMFARLGFKVTAVDISPNAINKLSRVASQQNIEMTTILEDITAFRPDHKYDLILAHGLLHLVHVSDRQQLIDRFKRSTRTGGYNFVVVITNKVSLPSYTKRYMDAPFNDGELRRYYNDWDILVDEAYSQSVIRRIPYRRHFNRMVARCTT